MRFDHLGLVVASVVTGRTFLSDTFGISEWTDVFDDPINGVILQFGRDPSGMCYELLEPAGEGSPLHPSLTNRRAILNHVAYLVDDLAAGAAQLRRQRCAPVAPPKPAIAYGGALIQFFATPMFFVVELVQAPAHEHLYRRG